ncbi:amidohydrolase [Vibrio sp. WXL103]|uniref:amidohydrolase n=1 Tax=unclassified Vibrio TaxID=2614977 RepID=UPI003EC5F680
MKRTTLTLAILLASGHALAEADLILTNADIITVTGETDRAQAVAIKDGLITAVGSNKAVLEQKGANTVVRDFAGKTVTPGFIDTHGHFMQYLPVITNPFLYPAPMGKVNNIADYQAALKAHFSDPNLPNDRIHAAWGYDNAELAEARHPTRWELDEVTGDYSVCTVHISGHIAVCNSAALERMDYTSESKNPDGGVVHRAENGELTGVLEESAIYPIFPHLIMSPGEAEAKIEKIQDMYVKYGITTTQEGAMTGNLIPAIAQMAEAGLFKIDLHLYAKWTDYDLARETFPMREYNNGVMLAGIKMVGDGSPQGKTAYLSTPYFEPPHSHSLHYHGYPVMPQADMNEFVLKAYEDGAHVLSHANGDAAGDILINAVQNAVEQYPELDHRTVMIHAQTARLDQIEKMKSLGMIPSFFAAHTYFWGDYHRDSVLGPWRASHISPMGWANEHDLMFTIHMDAPVLFPDMTTLMWTAVNRVTRSGQTLGEWHKISPYQALEAITIHGAYQNFEEAEKGSIEVGKRADLTVLDANPLDIDPMKIKDISVLETIKDGVSIYAQ